MKDSDFEKMDLLEYHSLVQKVESYCFEYQIECENSGLGTKYKTYREIAKRFSLTYDQIEVIIDDSITLNNMDAMSENKGDWEIGCL